MSSHTSRRQDKNSTDTQVGDKGKYPTGPASYKPGMPTPKEIDEFIRSGTIQSSQMRDLLDEQRVIERAIQQHRQATGGASGATSQGNRRPRPTQQSYTTPQLGSGGTSSRRPQRPGGGSEGRVRVGYIHYPRKPTPKEVKRFLDNGDKIDPPRPIWQLQTFREQQEEQEVILQMIQRQQQKIGGKVPFDGK